MLSYNNPDSDYCYHENSIDKNMNHIKEKDHNDFSGRQKKVGP